MAEVKGIRRAPAEGTAEGIPAPRKGVSGCSDLTTHSYECICLFLSRNENLKLQGCQGLAGHVVLTRMPPLAAAGVVFMGALLTFLCMTVLDQ